MTCEALIDFLTDYLDGRLPLGQRAVFELHLTLCRSCRDYLHNYRATIDACRTTYAFDDRQELPDLPPELMEAILKTLREQ